MIRDRAMLIGLALVGLALIAIGQIDDGMATCQLSHSFSVCHASLH